MKIMVICAGGIGSHFCHVFCENGHEVTVVARGARKGELEKKDWFCAIICSIRGLWIMSKTPLVRLAASDYCKNAVGPKMI